MKKRIDPGDEKYDPYGVLDAETCASYAGAALETFCDQTGLGPEDGKDTAVADLLADLMHYCDVEGLSFSGCLARAEGNYEAEKGDFR